jgi:hypothetical protein
MLKMVGGKTTHLSNTSTFASGLSIVEPDKLLTTLFSNRFDKAH